MEEKVHQKVIILKLTTKRVQMYQILNRAGHLKWTNSTQVKVSYQLLVVHLIMTDLLKLHIMF